MLSRFLILLANSGAAAIKPQCGLQQPNKQTNNSFPQRQTNYVCSCKGLGVLLHVAHFFFCLFYFCNVIQNVICTVFHGLALYSIAGYCIVFYSIAGYCIVLYYNLDYDMLSWSICV